MLRISLNPSDYQDLPQLNLLHHDADNPQICFKGQLTTLRIAATGTLLMVNGVRNGERMT
jgi:hypothetical protein